MKSARLEELVYGSITLNILLQHLHAIRGDMIENMRNRRCVAKTRLVKSASVKLEPLTYLLRTLTSLYLPQISRHFMRDLDAPLPHVQQLRAPGQC